MLKIAVTTFVVASLTLCAAQSASADDTSTLLEGSFEIMPTLTNVAFNWCHVFAARGIEGFSEFGVDGQVGGEDPTNSDSIRIGYQALQATGASRSDTEISVQEKKFSEIVFYDDRGIVANTDYHVVAKCSVAGAVFPERLVGSVTMSCGGKTLPASLTIDVAASVQRAFNGRKDVKVKFNADGAWSISIKCKGALKALK